MFSMRTDGEGGPPQTRLAQLDGPPPAAQPEPNYNFRKYDQSQQFLVPVSIRDWIEEGSKVEFLDALFNSLDRDGILGPLYQSYRSDGWGAPAYHPLMMVKILFYSICYGVLSSRKLAWLLHVNMELRFLSGNKQPNFRTICDFRNRHNAFLSQLFVDVLDLCKQAGLVSVGRIALDGTKMKANASLEKSYTRETIARKIKQLLEEARLIDEQEDDAFGSRRGDELPEDLRSEGAQRRVIDEALRRLAEARQKEEMERQQQDASGGAEKAESGSSTLLDKAVATPQENVPDESDEQLESDQASALLADSTATDQDAAAGNSAGEQSDPGPTHHNLDRLERMLDAYEQAGRKEQRAQAEQQEKIEQREKEEAETGKMKRGKKPTPPDEIRFPDSQGNITDPDSRIMMDGHGHYLQGYNCQASVTTQGNQQIITACGVTQEENDYHQLRPMMDRSEANVGEPAGQWVADAGYYTDAEVELFISDTEMFVNTKKGWQLLKELREQGPPRGRIPKDLSTRERMERKLRTQRGQKIYASRFNSEAVFGQMETRGIDRFYRRGLQKVDTDWSMICSSSNILKLHDSGNWFISDGYLHIEPPGGLASGGI